jgi:hypothetical protein
VTLSAGFQFEAVGWLGATMTGYYPGTLEFSGDQLSLSAEGMPVLDTVFGTGPFHLKWDFSGRLKTLVPSAGDYLDDDIVDGADFLKWQSTLGQSVTAGSDADGDDDGRIGEGDLNVWKVNYGFGVRSSPAAVGVPEPGTAMQALAAMLLAACCRSRSRNDSALRA